jgi:predicted DNA-binding transcriptional regulator YafY
MKAKEYTKTLSILLDLINRLYSSEKLTTTDIENIYQVSRRTAQRYINYLKEAGFNIQKEKKRYFLKTIVDEEKETIFEAIISLAKNAGIEKELIPFLNQLKLISEENVIYSKLDIEKIEPFIFSKIEEAIKNKKIIKMKYLKDKKLYNFEIKPLKISNFDGYWYVNALNHEDKYRTYHIKSIKDLKVTKNTFKLEEELLKNLDKTVNIWYDPTKEPILVELFADEYATKYLSRIPISKTQKLYKNQDNTSTIYIEITHKNEIIRKILMWIPHLKVISPKWIDDEIREMIKNY